MTRSKRARLCSSKSIIILLYTVTHNKIIETDVECRVLKRSEEVEVHREEVIIE